MNKSYEVLARKYRPRKLSAVLGQNILTDIFKNSAKQNRLGQVFLLTGIRGTGKTTLARIFAAFFNCSNSTFKEELEPCNNCENCTLIQKDSHPDVIEIDAASRSKVEDMRELMQSLVYEPIIAKFKVFIIDEVHMLSKSASNAMLKNLEEPPPYVKFILATTEIEKIPDTILSRCQSFHLKRIKREIVSKWLKSVTEKEQIQIQKPVLDIIAEASEGSMRDALSILEQVLCIENPDEEKVLKLLGRADPTKIKQLISYCLEGYTEHAIKVLEDLDTNGLEANAILNQILKELNSMEQLPFSADASKIVIQSIEEAQFLQDSFVTMKICTYRMCSAAKANESAVKNLVDALKKLEDGGASISVEVKTN